MEALRVQPVSDSGRGAWVSLSSSYDPPQGLTLPLPRNRTFHPRWCCSAAWAPSLENKLPSSSRGGDAGANSHGAGVVGVPCSSATDRTTADTARSAGWV